MMDFYTKQSPIVSIIGMGGGMGGFALVGGGSEKTYVEDVFSIDLWNGNYDTTPAPININNEIDLSASGRGGLVWTKNRNYANSHQLYDTERGAGKPLYSNITNGEGSNAVFDSFNSDGFSLTAGSWGTDALNGDSDHTFAAWTFGNQKGFFNAVKYTSTETTNVTIPHGLDSIPGMVVIKNIDSQTTDWQIWHRSLSSSGLGITFGTGPAFGNANIENTAPDDTNFYAKNPGYESEAVTSSLGHNYIAYFFAHDDQRFGDDGNESIIKCGIYNDSSAGGEVNLGWEPQWILFKCTAAGNQWNIHDTLRGLPVNSIGQSQGLSPSNNTVEGVVTLLEITPTGFKYPHYASGDWIYVAIRRGPMKTPTDATKVFAVDYGNGSATIPAFDSGFPVDFAIAKLYGSTDSPETITRLTGSNALKTDTNAGEVDNQANWVTDSNVGWAKVDYSTTRISWMFQRAPGFFDVVCYDGIAVGVQTVTHNLGVIPEMMIHKARTSPMNENWAVYHKDLSGANYYLQLNTNDDEDTNAGMWDNTAPTDTYFTVGNDNQTNANGGTFVAYLFASCPGVSKVGIYTGAGSGTDVNVDCGFTAGARFVLIKGKGQAGHWFVYDTTRGINAGNDPFGKLNSDAAWNDGVTNGEDRLDPLSSGFTVSGSDTNHNTDGDTYIYLAIA